MENHVKMRIVSAGDNVRNVRKIASNENAAKEKQGLDVEDRKSY